jgi:SAM-dependent methyltransferase
MTDMALDVNRELQQRRVFARTKKVLQRTLARWIQRVRDRPSWKIPVGAVRFGDLRRFSPIGRDFGYDRGTPVDRYYIERFLARHADDVHGRVLELASNDYTKRFGGSHVTQSDVLSLKPNPKATIVGDLAQVGILPEAAFDCVILTQTLQYIYDLRAAVAMLHRALKSGGVLLVTAPGVTRVDVWPCYWAFTAPALRRLLEDCFGQDTVTTEAHGNILVATAFLYGLALEELEISDLNLDDENYPVTVAARAFKRADI